MDHIGTVLESLTARFGEPPAREQALTSRTKDEYRVRASIVRHWPEVDRSLRSTFNLLVAGQKPWPLYLYGLVGRGKTRAALCLCDALEGCRYWTVSDVMNAMLARQAPWQVSWGWDHDGPNLAILDELGMHAPRDFEFDAVKEFLDWREDKPAICISNHPPGRMREAYDERVESRLVAGTIFELKGPDRRRDHPNHQKKSEGLTAPSG